MCCANGSRYKTENEVLQLTNGGNNSCSEGLEAVVAEYDESIDKVYDTTDKPRT